MMMIEITIISSSRVKPCWRAAGAEGQGQRAKRGASPFPLCPFPLAVLPVTIFLSVQRRTVRFRPHIEDGFAAALARRVGGVIRRPNAPVGLPGHRIDWNPPEINFRFRNLLRR